MRARQYGVPEVVGIFLGGAVGVMLGLLVGAWIHGGSERVSEVFGPRSTNLQDRFVYAVSERISLTTGISVGVAFGWGLGGYFRARATAARRGGESHSRDTEPTNPNGDH